MVMKSMYILNLHSAKTVDFLGLRELRTVPYFCRQDI